VVNATLACFPRYQLIFVFGIFVVISNYIMREIEDS